MRFKFIIPFLCLFCIFSIDNVQAQTKKISINGRITNALTGEDIIGAIVYVKENNTGTSTNTYGYYTLSVPNNTQITIRYSSVGLQTQNIVLKATKDTSINIKLDEISNETEEIVISGDSPKEQIKKTQMGKIELNMERIKQLPVLFGEIDPLKTLQLLPGLQGGAEGTTGFYVRGGGADQNLIVLDEAIVYNANHLFGLFSVFNGDAVSNLQLYKGGYPAKYGGRLSSVIDIKMKEGNSQKFKYTGGIGLIASRLTVEGPIKKDKGSFLISGRRTYFDVFTRAYNRTQTNNPDFTPIPDYYFYDLNLKINYQITEKDRIFVSGYFGRDVFGFSQSPFNFDFDWGNATGTIRWNHIIKPNLFVNTTASFTDYQYNIGNKSSLFSFKIGSSIRDWSAKQDYSYYGLKRHTISFGYGAIYHTFGIGRVQINAGDGAFNFSQDNKLFGWSTNAYINDEWELSPKWSLNYGTRLSAFNNKETWYPVVEPRLTGRYLVNDNFSIKGGYTRMAQYIHLVSNSGTSLPTDVWYPSTKLVKPQVADQLATGVTFTLFDESLTITDEVYYKWLYNQVDFKNAARLFFNNNLEEEFVFGKGWAYGNEIMIEKTKGKLTGWIGYTLAYSFRQFDSIQNGETIRPKYDIRHDLKVVGTYQLSKRWMVSATFVYNSGTLTTLPIGRTVIQDISTARVDILPIYGDRNNYRQPAYHRMDLGAIYKLKPKHGEADLSFSIYNAYDRRNAFFIFIDQPVPDQSQLVTTLPKAQAKQVSLFPIIPSVTYNFRF
jgi:hypothetical protein